MDLNDVDFENLTEDVEVTYNSTNSGDDNQSQDPVHRNSEGIIDLSSSDYLTNDSSSEKEGDVLTSFLKYNGISDPNRIKFEDEDGIVKERAWNDLSFEEKMNILTTSGEEPERDLTDDEIRFINEMRRSKLSPEQYINAIRQKTVQDYAGTVLQAPQYSIDNLSDDEVFLLDLQDKIEDASDEELITALNKAKEDPLFLRRVAGLRKTLKTQEEQYLQQISAEQQQQQLDQYNQFKDSIISSIQSLDKVGDLDLNLERDDMEDIASFILDVDDSGMSYFGKALNDPKTLVEMAWWTLKGRDALNSISEYFVNEIKNQKLISYQKGMEDAKKSSSRVVYKTSNKNDVSSIDNIWG